MLLWIEDELITLLARRQEVCNSSPEDFFLALELALRRVSDCTYLFVLSFSRPPHRVRVGLERVSSGSLVGLRLLRAPLLLSLPLFRPQLTLTPYDPLRDSTQGQVGD